MTAIPSTAGIDAGIPAPTDAQIDAAFSAVESRVGASSIWAWQVQKEIEREFTGLNGASEAWQAAAMARIDWLVEDALSGFIDARTASL